MAKLAPIFNDAQLISGIPANGAKLFTYVAGSSTKQATYADEGGITPQSNPIILDSRGEPSQPIWLTEGESYKFVFSDATDTDPPTSPIRTIDNVTGINDASIALSQWVDLGFTPTYISATSFSLPGDQTSQYQVYRRIKATITAGTVYGYILTSAYAALTTVTVVLDSGVLDSGLSRVELGLITPDNTSLFYQPQPTTLPSTPAQFDNDTSIATTEFVQRALGGYSTITDYTTAGQTIPASQANRLISLSASASSIIMPLANTVPAGTVIRLVSVISSTINRQGADKFSASSTSPALTSISIADGGDLILVSDGVSSWKALGLNAFNYSPSFYNLFNATGSAPIYSCRAWVNFNGTGTVAIRASGNVSSITDNGTGDYTLNFTTALPNANYAATFGGRRGATNQDGIMQIKNGTTPTTTTLQVLISASNGSSPIDADYMNISIFR